MAWTYNVRLKTFKHNGAYRLSALYPGAPGYKDNPTHECVKDLGPIPKGKYKIVGIPFTHERAGKFTLRLESDKSNNMCGRNGFLIHGESRDHPGEASNGCIVLEPDFRKAIWNSMDKELIVE